MARVRAYNPKLMWANSLVGGLNAGMNAYRQTQYQRGMMDLMKQRWDAQNMWRKAQAEALLQKTMPVKVHLDQLNLLGKAARGGLIPPEMAQAQAKKTLGGLLESAKTPEGSAYLHSQLDRGMNPQAGMSPQGGMNPAMGMSPNRGMGMPPGMAGPRLPGGGFLSSGADMAHPAPPAQAPAAPQAAQAQAPAPAAAAGGGEGGADPNILEMDPATAAFAEKMFGPMANMYGAGLRANTAEDSIDAMNKRHSEEMGALMEKQKNELSQRDKDNQAKLDTMLKAAGIHAKATTDVARIRAGATTAAAAMRGHGGRAGSTGNSFAEKADQQRLKALDGQDALLRKSALTFDQGFNGLTMDPAAKAAKQKMIQDQLTANQAERSSILQRHGGAATSAPAANPADSGFRPWAPGQAPNTRGPQGDAPGGAPNPQPKLLDLTQRFAAQPGDLIKHSNGNFYQVLQPSPDGKSEPIVSPNPINPPQGMLDPSAAPQGPPMGGAVPQGQ